MTDSIESVFFRSDKVATVAELLARGASRDQLRRWARNGRITSVAHGVYSPTQWLESLAGDSRRLHAVAVGAIIPGEAGLHRPGGLLLARDEKFHDEGWGTFHFTWREIYHEPEPAIERLRRTFARSTPRSPTLA